MTNIKGERNHEAFCAANDVTFVPEPIVSIQREFTNRTQVAVFLFESLMAKAKALLTGTLAILAQTFHMQQRSRTRSARIALWRSRTRILPQQLGLRRDSSLDPAAKLP